MLPTRCCLMLRYQTGLEASFGGVKVFETACIESFRKLFQTAVEHDSSPRMTDSYGRLAFADTHHFAGEVGYGLLQRTPHSSFRMIQFHAHRSP